MTKYVLLVVLFIGCDTVEASLTDKEGYVTSEDDVDLYYRVTGTGPDTIVVVHGGPGAGMNSFLPSVKPLAEHFVLVFYDQRGGGRSGLPDDMTKLQPHYFVEDLEVVRSFFGLKKMNILAHSFGSILISEYAKKYPNRLKRLVFHGATGPRRSGALDIMRAQAAGAPPPSDTALANRAAALLQRLLRGTAADPVETCRTYEALSRELAMARGEPANYKGTTCAAPPEAVHYYYRYTAQLAPRYYGDWDFTTGLEQVSAPLLVVYGKRDSLALPAQREWASSVPNGRLLLVPKAGKAAFSENPDFFVSAVTTFFRGSWPNELGNGASAPNS